MGLQQPNKAGVTCQAEGAEEMEREGWMTPGDSNTQGLDIPHTFPISG